MGIVTIILVFGVMWWLVFFAVLPIGIQSQHESTEDTVEGTDPGAPVKPNLLKKVLWTTLITALLTFVFYMVVTSGFISFRDMAPKPLEG
ncbi:hypothetical protein GCM10017044_24770 [Kordiimonas sediminis]|uniref:DUF1467 family protein n=1 Tax=Kordiimonas sediminis TaxID=1735581 RepID=A0A919E9X4_9PROT|nr:DUF1467 family protein [Kordiimonas sediminis]GHF28591.1 hypothetical protein GCM10017044_24770 [Kordiimonas sediminis]